MKIDKVKINNFGNLQEKNIMLKNNINIIYGENEAGKSTFLKCMVSSMYGISKNKNKKEISDYDKYTPWNGEDYSSKICYTLDNEKKYEVFNDFKKRKTQVFDENMNDISNEFNISKAGNEFFYEQTNISESTFLSTLVVSQQEVKIGLSQQNSLIQKIANILDTGEDEVSYEKALKRINDRQLEEIGSKTSKGKPINILNLEIEKLNEKKAELIHIKNFKIGQEEKINVANKKIGELEYEKEVLFELKEMLDKENIQKEKVNINNNMIKENIQRIEILVLELNNIEKVYVEEIKKIEYNYNGLKNQIEEEKIRELDELKKENNLLEEKMQEKSKKEFEKNSNKNNKEENADEYVKEIDQEKNTNTNTNTKKDINTLKIGNAIIVILFILCLILIMVTKNQIFNKALYLAIPILISVFIANIFIHKKTEKKKEKQEEKRLLELEEQKRKEILIKLEEEKQEEFKKLQIELAQKEKEIFEKEKQERIKKLDEVIKEKENIVKFKYEEDRKKVDEKFNYDINIIKGKIELSDKNNKELNAEINNILEKQKIMNIKDKKTIKDKYLNKVDCDEIKLLLEKIDNNIINVDNINFNIQNAQNKLNEAKINLNSSMKDKQTIENQLDMLNEIEERILVLNDKKEELEKLSDVMETTRQVLYDAYEEMKSTVSPKFCVNISDNISAITDGKYTNIRVNDKEGLMIEIKDGRYIPMSRLSVGTIDALYLSLRLSILEELSNENMPIILDETFAYFDNVRLTNIIKYLIKKYTNKQIILFTCTNREKEILEKEKIEYNLINM